MSQITSLFTSKYIISNSFVKMLTNVNQMKIATVLIGENMKIVNNLIKSAIKQTMSTILIYYIIPIGCLFLFSIDLNFKIIHNQVLLYSHLMSKDVNIIII